MNKRGVIEVQFNWIFILIAGALILSGAFYFVNVQRKISDRTTSQQILQDLERIITEASIWSGVAFPFNIPDIPVALDCDGCYLRGYGLDFRHQTVFGPNTIRGDSLTIWVMQWAVPFKVANFVYFTSPEVRYVFVDDDGFIEYLNETVEHRNEEKGTLIIRKDVTNSRNYDVARNELYLTDTNNYKVRFIFSDNSNVGPSVNLPGFVQKLPDSDVTALQIIPDSSLVSDDEKLAGFGEIKFYQKQGNILVEKGSSFYIGKASLYAALFTDSKNTYECVMLKAFARMKILNELYRRRTEDLKNFADSRTGSERSQWQHCIMPYATALDAFDEISMLDWSEAGISSLQQSINTLQAHNQNLQILGCRTLY